MLVKVFVSTLVYFVVAKMSCVELMFQTLLFFRDIVKHNNNIIRVIFSIFSVIFFYLIVAIHANNLTMRQETVIDEPSSLLQMFKYSEKIGSPFRSLFLIMSNPNRVSSFRDRLF